MSIFNHQEPGTAARARTNMFKLPGAPERIVERLLFAGGETGHIQAVVVEVSREKRESSAAYHQRLDGVIKDSIRRTLGLPASAKVRYNRFKVKKDQYAVLYLGAHASDLTRFTQVMTEHQLDARKVIQSLLELHLKQTFLNDVSRHYEIAPVEFNADLYLGLLLNRPLKNGLAIFDALEYRLYFSTEQELVLDLQRVVMECSVEQSAASKPVTETGVLMFDWEGQRYQRTSRKLNANVHSNRNYMAFAMQDPTAFKRYENTVNYHETDCLNRLQHILHSLDIEFTPVVFEASHLVRSFLTGLPAMTNPLWLLNNLDSMPADPRWQDFINELPQRFGASRVLAAGQLPAPDQLAAGSINYLIINENIKAEGSGKGGSSIVEVETEESLNTFWKALAEKQSNPDRQFDYYTEVKAHRFIRQTNSICQGLNLDVGKVPTGERAENAFNAKVEKILQELVIKEAIYKERALVIEGACLPAMSLVLLACRRDWEKNVYIQALDVVIADDSIRIEKSRRYDTLSQGQFDFDFPELAKVTGKLGKTPFEAIWNGAFLMKDKASEDWLSAYQTSRIPRIVGNVLFDNQQLHEAGTAPTRKVNIQEAALPYYNTSTKQSQRHGIHIQDNGSEGAWFFVAASQSPKNTIAKQNLVYTAVVTNQAGEKLPALNHPLGELFFATFTYDIVKLKASAKKSILQKMVEVCLHN